MLAAQLVSGTLVTAAGPHAGDKSTDRVVPRLEVEITTLVQLHTSLLVAYLALLVALGFALTAVRAPRPVLLRLGVLLGLVLAQGFVGTRAVLHRCAGRAGGDPRGGRGRMHGRHRGAMGVDARTDQARAGPTLTRTPSANWRC